MREFGTTARRQPWPSAAPSRSGTNRSSRRTDTPTAVRPRSASRALAGPSRGTVQIYRRYVPDISVLRPTRTSLLEGDRRLAARSLRPLRQAPPSSSDPRSAPRGGFSRPCLMCARPRAGHRARLPWQNSSILAEPLTVAVEFWARFRWQTCRFHQVGWSVMASSVSHAMSDLSCNFLAGLMRR